MTLQIVHPRKNEEVFQDFTAFGKYEYPNDLVGVLVRLLPKPHVVFGKLKSVQEGTWNLTLHRKKNPLGTYTLVVLDPSRGMIQSVPIKVRKVPRLMPARFRITYPQAGGSFNPSDTATGYAPVPAGTPDPNVTVVFMENNGAGLFTSNPGTSVDLPTSANGYYWSTQFDALPTDKNPCRCQATSDQPAPQLVNNDNVTISAGLRRPPKKKAKAKTTKAKKHK